MTHNNEIGVGDIVVTDGLSGAFAHFNNRTLKVVAILSETRLRAEVVSMRPDDPISPITGKPRHKICTRTEKFRKL